MRRIVKNDVGSQLTMQLQQYFGRYGEIALKREKPWASITFSGTRHYFELITNPGVEEKAVNALLAPLISHEFDISGQFVADILVHLRVPADARIAIDILTIIDPVPKPAD